MPAPKKIFPLGVVLGKFMPPHHGHRLVIDTALAQSDRVVLVVCRQADDPIPADLRVGWLRQLYPPATVRPREVTFPVTDAEAWARGTMQAVGGRPSAVFTSEEYGHHLAELLHCTHVLVDRTRRRVPVSASQIRENPEKYSAYLDPLVYQYFIAKK